MTVFINTVRPPVVLILQIVCLAPCYELRFVVVGALCEGGIVEVDVEGGHAAFVGCAAWFVL